MKIIESEEKLQTSERAGEHSQYTHTQYEHHQQRRQESKHHHHHHERQQRKREMSMVIFLGQKKTAISSNIYERSQGKK